ncbi:MAG: MmoB/DmpM family protein [Gammaproteobacteria bacterium]|nr:MmoB/DmpM family protein [Gammaproteobacteria bacterium]
MSVAESNRVAVVLIKSAEADATLDVLRADHPRIGIEDLGPYWMIATRDDEIVIDLDRVGQELGEFISLGDWLVVMSSFVGRVMTDPRTFRVTSQMLDFEPVTSA